MKAKLFFFILIGLAVILMAGGVYGFIWARGELLEKKEQVAAKQLELDDTQKRIEQLVQLSRRYETAKTRSAEIDRALPRASQQAEILLELKAAAAQAGVSVSSLQFTGAANPLKAEINQATPQKDLYVLPISLRLSGTYPQLVTYLNRLDTLSRFNNVVSLNATKVQANRDVLDVNLNLVAYLKP